MGELFRGFLSKAYQALHGAAGQPEITVEQLKQMYDAKESFVVLDVREDWEVEIAKLPGSVHIPLMELPERIGELDPKKPLVVQCHVGGRSARAVQFLRKAGFEHAVNLAGGIAAWSERVDPAVPQY